MAKAGNPKRKQSSQNKEAKTQEPKLRDYASKKDKGPVAFAVRNRRMKVDPAGNSMEELNTDILSIWTDDIKGVLGTERLDKLGSAIPYIFNVAGDLLINPSTVSPSTFKKMVESDYTIFPAMTNIINGVVNSIGRFTHDSKEIQEFGRKAIKKNARGFRTLCRDMLTSLYAGFSRVEKVWDWWEEYGCDVIVDTQPLPQNSIVFRVDAYGELQEDGVGQYIFNSFFPGFSSMLSYGLGNVYAPLLGGSNGNFFPNTYTGQQYGTGTAGGPDPFASLGDLDTPYRTWTISPIGLIWLPTDKTIGMEYYGITNNKNPYGKSILRSCYNLFVFKYGVLQFLGEALDKKSCPLLIGYARADVPVGPQDPEHPGESLIPTAFQQGSKVQDATAYLAQALAVAKGSSAVTLAGMKGEVFAVDSIDIQGDLNIFIDTLRYVDECILMNLMTPKTIFQADGGGSYSLSYSQSDVLASFKMNLRKDLKEKLLDAYMRPMIEEAFTEEEHEGDFGEFEEERTSIDDQVKLSTIYKDQIEDGVIDLTDIDDYNFVRENLGLKKKESVPDYVKKMAENMAMSDSPTDKRGKMDSTEKPYAHHKDK